MTGHSKWTNIRNKKAKESSKRSKVFTRIANGLAIVVQKAGLNLIKYNMKINGFVSLPYIQKGIIQISAQGYAKNFNS